MWACDYQAYINKSGKYIWNPNQPAVGQPCNPSVDNTNSGQSVTQSYVASIPEPVTIVETPPAVTPAEYTQEPAYPAPVSRTYYRAYRRHKRSKAKSVAIVLGSAAAGAGIGALAGGGPGAAIGAASGGTAGFIYDRLTHNR